MTTHELPQTVIEILPALDASRDARVTRCHGTLACIEMDDDGNGPFERVVTDEVASELVRRGLVRDARPVTVSVVSYRDGDQLGTVEMDAAEWERYADCTHPAYQWPEGVARAGDVLSDDQLEALGIDGGTGGWLE
jgi:hypothetical protein